MSTRKKRVSPEHDFTLIVEGVLDDETTINALFDAGCDDASFGMIDDVGYADFSRGANTFAEAVRSAISDVEAVRGLQIVRIEPDDLVTMSDIARRLGRTRESVRLLVSGRRGKGDFPHSFSGTGRSRFWRWSDVAAWAGDLPPGEYERARLVAAVNAALELRRQRPELAESERALIDALAG